MKIRTISSTVRLLTDRPQGHTLNRRQVISPNREWAVFDSRNEDTKLGETISIERIHLQSGSIESLYRTRNPNLYGPGVGAAAYHPERDRVIFIHGLNNCNEQKPYGSQRRFGALLDIGTSTVRHAESRSIGNARPIGVLSGGTHAHSWSSTGSRISFTYNDAMDPLQPRTIGFSTTSVAPPDLGIPTDDENFLGEYASFLAIVPAQSNTPYRIQSALEECWVHENQMAFLGSIPTERDESLFIQEIFSVGIPEDSKLQQWVSSRIQFSHAEALFPIKRLTHTEHRSHPGIQGPRHWLTTDPMGDWVYTLARDDAGTTQLARVASQGGPLELLTDLSESVEGQISCNRSGDQIAFVSGGRICVLSVLEKHLTLWEEQQFEDPKGKRVERPSFRGSYVNGLHFVDEQTLLGNRYVEHHGGKYLQMVIVRAT